MGTWFATPQPPGRRLTPFQACVRELSERLVRAQRPIRVLQSLRWETAVQRDFLARGCRTMPVVTRESYSALPFAPAQKIDELDQLERDVHRRLGPDSAAGSILLRLCREHRGLVQLLHCRGTKGFAALSAELYGRALERVGGEADWSDCARRIGVACPSSDEKPAGAKVSAHTAARMLAARLASYFRGHACPRVSVSDSLSAEAAAGRGYLKLRLDARFTLRDVRLLEIHEGWIHLGTTINGLGQRVCTFLARGSPAATLTQEGLAIATEVLAGASSPERLRKLCYRLQAVALAERGANFLDVFRFFSAQGYSPRESYQHAQRIFRGSLPEGCGPFTKDACYLKGFILVLGHLVRILRRTEAWTAPLLFCGKTVLAEMASVRQLAEDGLVAPPRHVPPPFLSRNMLAASVARWRRSLSPALAATLFAIMDLHTRPRSAA